MVASLSEARFLELIQRQPRLMVELGARAVTRAETIERRSTAANVIAVLNLTGTEITETLAEALAPFGPVETIGGGQNRGSARHSGISESGVGDPGEISVSRMLREAEMASEHLVLDVGSGSGPFAHRCFGMADRLLSHPVK